MADDALLGRTIGGKYTIEALIGGGAMGHVYRARHDELERVVALKIMKSDLASDPMFQQRFHREARAASRLDHPNSVRVIDYGREPDGLVYLAMEFLDGRDLHDVIRQEWPLPDDRIVDILAQTLAAVSRAHALGIIHRDLKPENIMILPSTDDDGKSRDVVKVCDFGIAKLIDPRALAASDTSAINSSGKLIGTPEYMSPEQARGETLDPRSDLYSIGIILYHLLVGRVPFKAENVIGVVVKQITDTPIPPSFARPGVHPQLEAICLRALEKNPGDRYQTARAMRLDFRAVYDRDTDRDTGSFPTSEPRLPAADVTSPTVLQTPETPEEVTLPLRSSRPLVIAALLALTVAGVAAASFLARRPAFEDAPIAPSLQASPALSSMAPSAQLPAPRVAIPRASTVSTTPRAPVIATAPPVASRPPAALPPAAAPPPPAAPPPEYNPSSAFVSLATLTTERVDADAVRRTIEPLLPRLSECYRTVLYTLGAPQGGSAEIHMSVDPSGHVTAIVTAPKLAPFQRCAGQILAGLTLHASAVEAEGGNASQALTLHP